jgi:hypothetical protein
MTSPLNFPAARGKLVGPQGPIPEAFGIVARLSKSEGYLIVTPWPLPPTGSANLAVEIDATNGAGTVWVDVESIEVEQVPNGGWEGTIGLVELRGIAMLADEAVPLVPRHNLQQKDIRQGLADSNSNVRLMLGAVAPGLLDSTRMPASAPTPAVSTAPLPVSPPSPSFLRPVPLAAPRRAQYSGRGICRLLRID